MDFLGFIIILIKVLVVFAATLLTVLMMVYAERRVSAFMQGRLGPNRVGPQGLLQPIADGIKFLMKEDIIPAGVDKPIFILAPAIMLIPALMTFAVIPFGSDITLFGRQIPLQVAANITKTLMRIIMKPKKSISYFFRLKPSHVFQF